MLVHSPFIVREDLLFYYDMYNTQKSWKGKPTTNLCTNLINWNMFEYYTPANISVSLTPNATLAPDNSMTGILYTPLPVAYNQYLWSGGNISDQWHTISMYVKYNGYRYAKFGSSTQNAVFDLLAGTWVTPGNSAVNVGNGWWRLTIACYVNGGYLHNFWSSNSSGGGGGYPAENITPVAGAGTYIWGVQVEAGTFASSYVADTRSNTQSLLDLTGQTTITSENLTYNSDGTFSFDGTDDTLNLGNSILLKPRDNLSICLWLKPADTQVQYADILSCHGGGYQIEQNSSSTNNYYFSWWNGSTWQSMTPFALTANTWQYLVVQTDFASFNKAYVNTTLSSQSSVSGPAVYNLSKNLYIGRWSDNASRFWKGSIASVSIYNSILTEAQIKQNFNAQRGRFGV